MNVLNKNIYLIALALFFIKITSGQPPANDQAKVLTYIEETFKKFPTPKPSSNKEGWFRFRKLLLEDGILRIMYTMERPKNGKIEGYHQILIDLSNAYYRTYELNFLRSNSKCGIKTLSYYIDKNDEYDVLLFNDISRFTEGCGDFYLNLSFLDMSSPTFKNGNYEKLLVQKLQKLMIDFGGGKKKEDLVSIPKLDNLTGISNLRFGAKKEDYSSIITKNGVDNKGRNYSIIDHTSNVQYQKIFGSDVHDIKLVFDASNTIKSIIISFKNNENQDNVHTSLVKNLGKPTLTSRDLDVLADVYTWKGIKRMMVLSVSTVGLFESSIPIYTLYFYDNPQ